MNSKLNALKLAYAKNFILSRKQREAYFSGEIARVQIERYNRILWKNKLIKRRANPWTKTDGHEITAPLLDETLSRYSKTFEFTKDETLEHRLDCSEIAISLFKREYVSGVTLEHDLERPDIDRFCPGRVPDGIVQITKPGREPFELGIEFERKHKSTDRTNEILDLYQKATLDKKLRCEGLLLVVPNNTVYVKYKALIEMRPEWFQKWIIISRKTDLSDVPQIILGRPLVRVSDNPFKASLTRRNSVHHKVKYVSDFEISANTRATQVVPVQDKPDGDLE